MRQLVLGPGKSSDTVKGLCNSLSSIPRATSIKELIYFTNRLLQKCFKLIKYYSIKFRGILASNHIHSPFITTSTLEATQKGEGSHRSARHDLGHFLLSSFSNAFALLQ